MTKPARSDSERSVSHRSGSRGPHNVWRDLQSGIATVIGFPHGNTLPDVKAYEAETGHPSRGAGIGYGHTDRLATNGQSWRSPGRYLGVVNAARRGVREKILVKVIPKTALLTKEEQTLGCQLAEKAGADFVKTSTGFAGGKVILEDIGFLRSLVGERLGIKAAGGIGDLVTAITLINAGATRLGTSSSVAIIKMWPV